MATGQQDQRRSRSQSRFDEFSSLSPPHRVPAVFPSPAAPYSSASLGPTFRSRSLDQRRFPAFTAGSSSIVADGSRAYYRPSAHAQQPQHRPPSNAPYASSASSQYKGELFSGGAGTGARQPQQPVISSEFRSSSDERPGVTVVPIRREATLPARRFEWKASEWRSGGVGGTMGSPLGGEDKEQPQQEFVSFDRSTRFNQQRRIWPPQGHYSEGARWRAGAGERMEMVEGPRAGYYPESADYSTFRRSNQASSEAAAAEAAQHREHFSRDRQQRQHREHREWHSGGHQQQQYGTLGTRRSAGERHTARTAVGGGGTAYQYREAASGGGHYGGQRYYQQQQQQQQHYTNGWGGTNAKRHGNGSAGYFGTGGEKSWSSGARWSSHRHQSSGPKHYRKIRCCCFNLIWPPWAVEPSGPPRPMYGASSSSRAGPPSPGAIQIPIEHHRTFAEPPPPQQGPRGPEPPMPPNNQQQQQMPPERGVPNNATAEGRDPGRWGRRE